MSDIWAPVIAALGASLLTGFFAFGLAWWQSRSAGKSALSDRRSRAYTTLLARTASIMSLASNLHVVMEVRSGLREGINVTLGLHKPLDPFELNTWMGAELNPVLDAWSEVWAVGSKEAIAASNDLLSKCGNVVGSGTQRGQKNPAWLRGIVGEKWTKEQLDQWHTEMRDLAVARKKFGDIVRKEIGVEAVDLFASDDLEATKPQQPPIVTSQTSIDHTP